MKCFALKTRFGVYAAGLATLGVVASMLAVRPLIYRHQLGEVDEDLTEDAEEFFRDYDAMQKVRDFRRPIDEKVIPATMRGRYIEVFGIDGIQLWRSKNLRGQSLAPRPPGFVTISLMAPPTDGGTELVPRNARIGTFTHGFLTLHVGTRLGAIESMQDDLGQIMMWNLPVTAVLVFGLGWLLGRRALRPVTALTAAAERIDAQHPDERLPLPAARDEIFRLTEVLNHSFDRLQQAYAGAARFSADASHQLKTPLAVLRAGLDVLRTEPSLPPKPREEVDALLKQTRRLTTLVEDLLLLAQMDAGRLRIEPEPIDLAALTRAMLDDVEILCAGRGLALEHRVPESLMAMGDGRRVAMILQNLSENAAKYAADGGRVTIVCETVDGFPTVSVANTGPAISDEHKARLFERFHRGNMGENIKGHGLGLNISRSLARAQGGDVRLVRSDGEWTEFQLQLPATPGREIIRPD